MARDALRISTVPLRFPELTDYRDAILRCYWDGEATPSVETPLGDFFTLAHARVRQLRTTLTAVNPGFGSSHGLHAYFPMPFAAGARITFEHRGEQPLGGALPALWYHIDYETYGQPLPDDALAFPRAVAAREADCGQLDHSRTCSYIGE